MPKVPAAEVDSTTGPATKPAAAMRCSPDEPPAAASPAAGSPAHAPSPRHCQAGGAPPAAPKHRRAAATPQLPSRKTDRVSLPPSVVRLPRANQHDLQRMQARPALRASGSEPPITQTTLAGCCGQAGHPPPMAFTARQAKPRCPPSQGGQAPLQPATTHVLYKPAPAERRVPQCPGTGSGTCAVPHTEPHCSGMLCFTAV